MDTTTVDPVVAARSALANASKRRAKAENPDAIIEARRNLTAAKMERAIREGLASAPPITPEQRAELAAILRGA